MNFGAKTADPWKRRVALAFGGSFLIFAAFPIFRITNPARTLTPQSDHYSHWGAAILLAFDGLDVYRHPIRTLCDAPTPAQRAENSLADCALHAHPAVRPFAVNWQKYPRVYPPGAMIFGAPEALLFEAAHLRFGQANLLIVLQILLFAHLASLALFLCLWRQDAPTDADLDGWHSIALFLVMPLVHLELVGNALQGVYDPLSIFGVVLGIYFLAWRRPVAALLALSFATFTHFRALWYLPLILLALWRVWKTRAEWLRSSRSVVAVVASALMLGLSAWCFVTLLPALRTFPQTNPFGLRAFRLEPGLVFDYGIPLGCILAVLIRNRSWLTAIVASWQLFMLLQTHEVQQWHALFALPLIGLAATERRGRTAALVAMLALYVWESRVIFSGWPLTGGLIADLLRT